MPLVILCPISANERVDEDFLSRCLNLEDYIEEGLISDVYVSSIDYSEERWRGLELDKPQVNDQVSGVSCVMVTGGGGGGLISDVYVSSIDYSEETWRGLELDKPQVNDQVSGVSCVRITGGGMISDSMCRPLITVRRGGEDWSSTSRRLMIRSVGYLV